MIFDSQIEIERGRDYDDMGSSNDSGMSLGTILVLLVSLVVVGGTCYGVGYMVGHKNLAAENAAIQAPATVKPVATQTASPAPTAAALAAVAQGAAPQTAPPPAAAPAAAAPAVQKPVQAESKPAAYTKSSLRESRRHGSPHATVVAHHNDIARRPDPFTHLVSNPNYGLDTSSAPSHPPMVQVAVLYTQEDATNLLDALSKHGFTAMANRERDNRIHVRLGPFPTRDDATAMRDKLLNNGYNAVIQ